MKKRIGKKKPRLCGEKKHVFRDKACGKIVVVSNGPKREGPVRA